ncbi:MAG: flagellar hook-length control protein FliK [Bacteriovorax sp.]|nr:flagellar hook-length control protein FliK [Rhizobacter sp.]
MSPLKATSLRAERSASTEPAAPAPSGGHAPASNADPAGFASLLRQSQAVAVAHARPEPAAPRPEPAQQAEQASRTTPSGPAADAAMPDDAESGVAVQPAPATAGKPRGATPAGAANRGARPSASGAGQPVPDADTEGGRRLSTEAALSRRADAGMAPDPALLQWIAGLPREPAVAAEARGASVAGASLGYGETAAGEGPPVGSAAAGTSRTDALAAAEGAAGTNQLAGPAEPGFAALLATDIDIGTRPAAEAARAAPGAPDAALAAAAAAGMLPAAQRPQAPPPLAVAVPTPVNAPEFQQALGLQLSVLARDGVQHAELHLNPADMGPVSVQIVVDGTQARVDFGADVAATREAIEAGLPALASAMHDAGFTLAGGGVSQHSRGRGDGSEPGSAAGAGPRARRIGAGAAADAAGAGAQRAVRRTVALGGVDLYA